MRKLAFLAIFIFVCSVFIAGCASEDDEIVRIVDPNDSLADADSQQSADDSEQQAEEDDSDETSDSELPDSDDSDENLDDAINQSENDEDSNSTMSNVTGNSVHEAVPARNLTVEFMDLAGNAVFIRTPRRKSVVIDGGTNSDGLDFVKYLMNKGLIKIDYLLSSNAETDNSGGMPSLIFNFNNSQAYCGPFKYNGKYVSYKSYQNYANAYSLPPILIEDDEIFEIEENLAIKAMVPFVNESNGEPINDTIVYRLNYKDASFLFLSDCKEICFENIKGKGHALDVDVLNVHGPVSEEILNITTPKIIVYDEITNETVKPDGVKVYSKEEGLVMILSNGQKYFISTLGKE